MSSNGGHGEQPWWASGAGPDDATGTTEDPLGEHRDARRGGAGSAPGDGRPWWEDAAEALHAAAERAAANRTDTGSRDGEVPPHVHGSDVEACRVCPVCIALRAFGAARPEMISHLSEAARHLSLAAKAFVDAQVEATGGGPDDLEHIDLDDE